MVTIIFVFIEQNDQYCEHIVNLHFYRHISIFLRMIFIFHLKIKMFYVSHILVHMLLGCQIYFIEFSEILYILLKLYVIQIFQR